MDPNYQQQNHHHHQFPMTYDSADTGAPGHHQQFAMDTTTTPSNNMLGVDQFHAQQIHHHAEQEAPGMITQQVVTSQYPVQSQQQFNSHINDQHHFSLQQYLNPNVNMENYNQAQFSQAIPSFSAGPGSSAVTVEQNGQHVIYSNGPSSYYRSSAEIPVDKNVLLVVHNFLKKYKLESTADLLKREAHISENDVRGMNLGDSDVQNVLYSYVSDENPDEYTDAYIQLKNFIDTSLDVYKYEVGQILWPVFVHMYLELVYNEHEAQSKAFFSRFYKMQETFHEPDMAALASITNRQHLSAENIFRPLSNCLISSSKGAASNLYVVRMSREAQSLLKRFLQEKRLKLVQNIVQDRLFVEVYDGVPRGKAAISTISGHFMGEACRQDNKVKVFYGLLREPDLQNVQVDPDEDEVRGSIEPPQPPSTPSSQKNDTSTANSIPTTQGTGSGTSVTDQKNTPSKKKKGKKDWLGLSKKGKNDPNAPPISRMPLPELRDVDKVEKAKSLREASKRAVLGTEKLPSICMYTLLNADNIVSCIKWSDDGSLMGVGMTTAVTKVWSLTPAKLKKMKTASDLADIDREADDVLVRMMDETTGEVLRTLGGHSGAVFSIDFSPDKSSMLTASEDTTIRLWSLLTWTCMVVYKGHLFPVWKAVFSPHGGYYFASAGHDRTARLWTTDNPQPLRIFAGHYSDVTAVVFHPNTNYVATGSADRSVRVWDCVSGSCVRLMTGHKGMIEGLIFSLDGRFLVSSSTDTKVLVWDISNGSLVASLTFHTGPAYSLSFSREGSVLVTGGQDCCVRLWNFSKLAENVLSEDGGSGGSSENRKLSCSHLLIAEFSTKNIPLFGLHFTRRNVLLASGPFQPHLNVTGES